MPDTACSGPVEGSTPDEADHVFAVNFFGPLALIRAALPRLREQRRGHIVNISSIAGVAPTPGAGLYAATKSALDGMSASLAQEVAPFGIWVTVVNPGSFRTEFLLSRSVLRTSLSIDDYAVTSGFCSGVETGSALSATPAIEEMLTMCPRRCSRRRGSAAREDRRN